MLVFDRRSRKLASKATPQVLFFLKKKKIKEKAKTILLGSIGNNL